MGSFGNFARIANTCWFTFWYTALLLFSRRLLSKFGFPARTSNKIKYLHSTAMNLNLAKLLALLKKNPSCNENI